MCILWDGSFFYRKRSMSRGYVQGIIFNIRKYQFAKNWWANTEEVFVIYE